MMDLTAGVEVRGQGPGGARTWRVIKPVGSGTCCKVYHVKLVGEEQQGALKVYKIGNEYAGAFERELLILEDLRKSFKNSKCIVQSLDEFTWRGHCCMVQELLYSDPRQLIISNQGEPLSLWMIQKLTRDIFKGTELLHSLGYLHGDIKPTNLMWSPQHDCLKLCDFGLSFHEEDEEMGELQSPSYRAPECERWNRAVQASRQSVDGEVDGDSPGTAADMWSIGCCIVDMFTGSKLFNKDNKEHRLLIAEGKSDAEVLVEHLIKTRDCDLQQQQQQADVIVDDLRDLVLRTLETDPEDRLSASEALRHEFFKHSTVPSFKDMLLCPTLVIRLLNTLTSEELTDPQLLEEVKEDIVAECEKIGPVVNCVIPQNGTGREKVFIEYSSAFDSQKAFSKINGRMFSDRTVITTYFPYADYKAQNFY